MSNLIIEITSVPDRENLVAEIWHNQILIPEIIQETGKFEIKFYFKDNMIFELNDFIETLQKAKKKLMEI